MGVSCCTDTNSLVLCDVIDVFGVVMSPMFCTGVIVSVAIILGSGNKNSCVGRIVSVLIMSVLVLSA